MAEQTGKLTNAAARDAGESKELGLGMKIKLEHATWDFTEERRLGKPGGFGDVFLGLGADGPVAIKRLKITAAAAAHRELAIARTLTGRTLLHVVPVLDYGQDADSDRYYLVMPVCERSLEEHLDLLGPLSWIQAKPIVLDIVAGLVEVGNLVHRDLKPANVLLYQGSWRIADFGIAKFVEDSTSLETLRDALTPIYAAPEQFRGERPTAATDVYALGCMIHTMLNGSPPFAGDQYTIQEGHLNRPPPPLPEAPTRVQGTVMHMLRKSPGSRPDLSRVSNVVQAQDADQARRVQGALAEVGREIAEQESKEEARQREERDRLQNRRVMADEAAKDLDRLMEDMYGRIDDASESVRRIGRSIYLGPATLTYEQASALPGRRDAGSFENGWDCISASKISLSCSVRDRSLSDPPRYVFSATLFYGRTDKDPNYRWREISFWTMTSRGEDEPFALSPNSRDFAIATSNVIGAVNVAHGPVVMDAEDEESFRDRWLTLFAKAAQGRLRRPMQMPIPAQYFGS